MKLIKYIFSFIGLLRQWYIGIANFLKLKSENVEYSVIPKINGGIIIKNKGRISIGVGVLFNCSDSSNEVGVPHPVILCTQNKKAEIIIGNNVGISGSSLVANTNITIGDNVLIGGGCGIWDTDFHPLGAQARLEHSTRNAKSSPILIEDNVFIGARSIVLKGVKVGEGAIVGAGTVVNKDVPAYSIAYGNPMKIKIKETLLKT